MKKINVLIYWHDIFLPYSSYLIEEFDKSELINRLIVTGPKTIQADAIFNVPLSTSYQYKKTVFYKLSTYKLRSKFASITSFYGVIKNEKPELIIVLDEAMSINVLNAGIANFLCRNNAKVLFYGFDNIPHKLPWTFLVKKLRFSSALFFLKRALRLFLYNHGLQVIRKRLVHGGLISYSECSEIIKNFGWNVTLIEQWWGLPLKKYFSGSNMQDRVMIRDRLSIPENQKVIGYVGRFIEEKGIMDLLNAFSELDNSYTLLLVGDGYLIKKITALLDEKEITTRVKICPPQSQDKLAAFYRAMDVLILPSRTDYFWKEQYGRVLIEAQACGVAVIGSNSGSIPFVINDMNHCFEEGNTEEIKFLLKKVIDSEKIELNKRMEFVQKADIKNFVVSYINLYQQIR